MDESRPAQWRVIEWKAYHDSGMRIGWRHRPGDKFKVSDTNMAPITEELAVEYGAKPLALFQSTVVYEMVKNHPAFYVDEDYPRIFVKLMDKDLWVPVNLDDGTISAAVDSLKLSDDRYVAPENVIPLREERRG